ncbi:glucosaminidase domain-containing protein [Pseudidiomarina insulisalsae]|uniref:Peptidoglycan hydrolase n=1 Tax=Pseudidiomarina insulisalsae TaxID=575789 RepID=A0A432YHE1_9GAMM|nr:glucosaminidase domain-containing protein [Pseudidiomarina insulisalsae]RUO60325.1 peptidoglycan hydrolase [Pseudidiomarina insulisalsae]
MLRALTIMLAILAVAAAIVAPNVLHLANPHRLYDNEVTLGEMAAAAPRVTTLPDFSQYQQTADKKQAFFGFLAPLVEAENAHIAEQRHGLEALYYKWQFRPESLTHEQKSWLAYLAKQYRVEFTLDGTSEAAQEMFDLLFRRVDQVPETLVLVQAANESAWGTSRFAVQALNLFGQWCFSEGCGLVPEARGADARHEVRSFDSVNASIASYMRNLNTHPAYFELRTLRAEQRERGRDIRALDLTPGLLSYSERGEDYVEELNAMIRVNRPMILDALEQPIPEEGPIAEPGFPDQDARSSDSAPE